MLADLSLLAINRLLAREGWARRMLVPHAGQCAQISAAGFRLRFLIDAEGLLAATRPEQTLDLMLDVPANALGSLAEGPEALRRAARIEGNAGLAETLATLAQHLRPDPGAALAPWLGDVLAHRLDRSARGLAATALEGGRRTGEALLERLQTSGGPLPSRAEFEQLRSGIARLQTRLDRLAKP